jgi:hypothetical protein
MKNSKITPKSILSQFEKVDLLQEEIENPLVENIVEKIYEDFNLTASSQEPDSMLEELEALDQEQLEEVGYRLAEIISGTFFHETI